MALPDWLHILFGTEKPVIAMAHIPALPGTPRYDKQAGVEHLIEWVRTDVAALAAGGVDAIMFCNEDDRPYVFQAGIEQIAAMTRVVADSAPTDLPFGIDFLWDPMAALVIAHATGASFMREVLTGTYESDMGLWSPDAGRFARLRSAIGADSVRVFYNVVPEFASPLGSRSVGERARSTVVSSLADVILVSGAMAGAEPNLATLEEVKRAVGNEVPVFLNTGARRDTIYDYLRVVDGVIVGSSLKMGGITWNRVEPGRVEAFMAEVKRARRDFSGADN
jgi:membrane complex biogenesis BtpA family protein